jgi:hypothetical protein
MQLPQTLNELFSEASREQMLNAMISQLNKDLALANVDHHFDEDLEADVLKAELEHVLERLFTRHYDDYLNLLYRIDVRDTELARIALTPQEERISAIAFVVLQRIYSKVWFRSRL